MNEIATYVLQRIAETPLKSDPFSHFFIEQIFPGSFYQELISHFPDPALYRYSESNDRRWVLSLDDETLNRIAPEQKLVWEQVRALLCGEKFLTAILEKFQP